jgi:2'-5' RNA ligase
MRLFVALNLPKKERDRIYRASKVLRECELPVSWVDPEHYHVTLKFLGEVPEERMEGVQEALLRVASTTGKLDLAVEGFGAFPTIRRPQVIWVGVEPSPALRCLKQDVEWALMGCGFDRETRAFHPHLTLGRADARDGAGAFRGLDEKAANLSYQGQVKVRKLDLMRSQLSKSGPPRYTLQHSNSFGG